MTIKTKTVQNRRMVRYDSYEELIAEAEQLATQDIEMLGNWSLGQVFSHLAKSLDSSIDGAGFMLPAPARWLMSLFLKRKFLTKSIPAGFKSSARFIPQETSIAEGLAELRQAVERQKREPNRAFHPGFGKITVQEWNDFNLRHAEMHMSFAQPQ